MRRLSTSGQMRLRARGWAFEQAAQCDAVTPSQRRPDVFRPANPAPREIEPLSSRGWQRSFLAPELWIDRGGNRDVVITHQGSFHCCPGERSSRQREHVPAPDDRGNRAPPSRPDWQERDSRRGRSPHGGLCAPRSAAVRRGRPFAPRATAQHPRVQLQRRPQPGHRRPCGAGRVRSPRPRHAIPVDARPRRRLPSRARCATFPRAPLPWPYRVRQWPRQVPAPPSAAVRVRRGSWCARHQDGVRLVRRGGIPGRSRPRCRPCRQTRELAPRCAGGISRGAQLRRPAPERDLPLAAAVRGNPIPSSRSAISASGGVSSGEKRIARRTTSSSDPSASSSACTFKASRAAKSAERDGRLRSFRGPEEGRAVLIGSIAPALPQVGMPSQDAQ